MIAKAVNTKMLNSNIRCIEIKIMIVNPMEMQVVE